MRMNTPLAYCDAGSKYVSALCLIPEEKALVHFGLGKKEIAEAGGLVLTDALVSKTLDVVVSDMRVSTTTHAHSNSKLSAISSTIASSKPSSSRPGREIVEFIKRVTEKHRTRQTSAFMEHPAGRRGDDVVVEPVITAAPRAASRVGSTECYECVLQPSHRLDPCSHTICYEHFLAYEEGIPLLCARCLQTVAAFHNTSYSSDLQHSWLGEGLHLSPTNSIWGSPSLSIQPTYESLNTRLFDMAVSTNNDAHEGANTNVAPSTESKMQPSAVNSGPVNGLHGMNGSHNAPSQTKHVRFPSFHPNSPWAPDKVQSQTAQSQQSKHVRFPSFHPKQSWSSNNDQPAVLNGLKQTTPDDNDLDSYQAQIDQIVYNNQNSSSNSRSMAPLNQAPAATMFDPSQAFRELASPNMMPVNPRAGPVMSQFPGHIQHNFGHPQQNMSMPFSSHSQQFPGGMQPAVNMMARAPMHGPMGVSSPVNMNSPFGVPSMGHFGHQNAPSVPNSSLQPSVSNMNGPPFDGPQSNGTMHGSHFNGTHMGGNMNGAHMSDPRMTGNPTTGHNMSAQSDPFVDNQRPMPMNSRFVPGPNNAWHSSLQNGPHGFQFINPHAKNGPVDKPVNGHVSGQVNGHVNGQVNSDIDDRQQALGPVEPLQEHQSEAAMLAQAIKDGLFEQSENKSHSGSRGYVAPNWDGSGLELSMQPVVRSQAVMVPDIRPDPSYISGAENSGLPTLDQVFDDMPLFDAAQCLPPSTAGVIKITNIPYATTKNEVVAALGRSARIASQPRGTPYFAIHIIMERPTGKTMDCYVELESLAEAKQAVSNFQQRCMNNRHPRIGDRHVEIELSSQAALMRDMFPRAKCVAWEGQVPVVYTTDEPYNSGFNGFITGEEMVMVSKHAETPQRSPFAQRCVNRTYESMISLLHKYPWFSGKNITLRERTKIYNTVLLQLRTLITAIGRQTHPPVLNRTLLQEYIVAALSNAGFSVQQKNYIIDVVQSNGYGDLMAFVPYNHVSAGLGGWWCFEMLSKKADVSDKVVQYYINLLRRSTTPSPTKGTLAQHAMRTPEVERIANSPFGRFTVRYPGDDMADCSLADVALAEWNAVEEALRGLISQTSGAVLALPASKGIDGPIAE